MDQDGQSLGGEAVASFAHLLTTCLQLAQILVLYGTATNIIHQSNVDMTMGLSRLFWPASDRTCAFLVGTIQTDILDTTTYNLLG